jgi:hypothetical protein
MNNMLTQIDDETLEQVCGVVDISIGASPIGDVVGGIAEGSKAFIDSLNAGAQKVIGLFPTADISINIRPGSF